MVIVTNIRNFVIIAHIDHGKSTLADRMLEVTKTVEARQMKAQYLDQLDLERERGITIKMTPVRMQYQDYILNLIDTPGHSDFSYEVSRALAAVEGAVLLVDATQGIQAQTLANFNFAKDAGLTIIPVINKIDLNPDGVDELVQKVAHLVGVSESEVLKVSAKTGVGVEELLQTVIDKVPPPVIPPTNAPFQALIFDSIYNDHLGNIAFIRVFSGSIDANNSAILLAVKAKIQAKEIGFFTPKLKSTDTLSAGFIGYLATGLKDPDKIRIGDTIVTNSKTEPLTGYREPKPVVFASFYPGNDSNYDDLKSALSRLKLNDSALTFEPDTSEVLGRGFKCGFLGRLHFEIVAERLHREFNLELVSSFPSVVYRVKSNNKEIIIQNPRDFPDGYEKVWQPMVDLKIITAPEHLSGILGLAKTFHISNIETDNLEGSMVMTAKMPLADLIRDFDDQLKSISSGFASMSYELAGEEEGLVDKLEILVAGEPVSGLTRVVARDELEYEGRQMAEKLKKLLPKQQFTQPIQAKSRGRILARETIPAMRKDVTGYLYGGDRTRKMKLWKKQQKGKKKLQARASVTISPSIYRELLKK